MVPVLLVALGGALGSVARYLVNIASSRVFGMGFPWGTLTVNVVGGFAMGLLAALLALKGGSQEMRVFLMTGVLGGFTTFSAFSLDAVGDVPGHGPARRMEPRARRRGARGLRGLEKNGDPRWRFIRSAA
ncbi:CrcB family protein [Hansschlegelia beijingensis]